MPTESTGRSTLPPVCPLKTRGRAGAVLWPCIRAKDHDGDCEPSVEAHHYATPLEGRDEVWLRSEVRCLLLQLEINHRDRLEAAQRERERTYGVAKLLDHVIRLGCGSGGKHDETCWTRHPSCLAKILAYRPESAVILVQAAQAVA